MDKQARRLALLDAAGGREPNGTGTPCADCTTPRNVRNTSVVWSDAAKTRLTFHYAVCDSCRSTRLCKRLRDDPAAKLVQMGADAAARTKKPRYRGEALAASACTERIVGLLAEQEGRCASCEHQVVLAAGSGIFMASLDKVGGRYDDGSAQVLCLGCQRLFNDLNADARDELTRAIVDASAEPRPRPLVTLPAEFERSVEVKLRQMRQREAATDRPSRGAPVELSVEAGCRRLRRCGLRCACALSPASNVHGALLSSHLPSPPLSSPFPAPSLPSTRSNRSNRSNRFNQLDPSRWRAGQRDQRAAERDVGWPLHVVL